MTQAADPSETDSGATSDQVIRQLGEVLAQRRNAPPDSSYVAALYAKGLNKILEKVGEEATEVILAARDCAEGPAAAADSPTLKAALVSEVADLWFHSMVALTHQNIAPDAVLAELERRFGVSGIEEKRSR